MSKKLISKLVLDFIMTMIMIVLMDFFVTGILLHEILGIIVLVLIIKHNVMNLNFYRGLLKNRNKKLNYKIYLRLIVNLLLTICSVFLGISSIMISESIFTFLNIGFSDDWLQVHRISSYLELILIAVHIGFHGEMILNSFRKMFRIKEMNRIRTIFLRLIAVVVALFGVKSSFDLNILSQMLPDNITEASQIEKTYVNPNTSEINGTKETNLEEKELETTLQASTESSSQTLEEYLGSLYCTACHKHCSLLNPRCNKGVRQANDATDEFEAAQKAQLVDEVVVSETDTNNTINQVETKQESIVFEIEDNSLQNLFIDYIPLMGIYILGTYYTLKTVDRVTKKEKMNK